MESGYNDEHPACSNIATQIGNIRMDGTIGNIIDHNLHRAYVFINLLFGEQVVFPGRVPESLRYCVGKVL